jgi:cytoskeletal protein RodZ
MTARREIRIGGRRLGRGQAPIDANPVPPVGETLQQARERKGVDLYRAERDTKIRLRYLSALEDSAYEDLPPPVYTKGFIRNYAIYLGLDPDELLERWRDEMESVRSSERIAVAPPPQPIAAPGRRLTVTPGMFVAGIAALVVLAFVGYLAIQLLRYAEVTPVGLTKPPNVFSTIDAESTVLEGTSGPGAAITIRGPGEELYSATANEEGDWSEEVNLARGRNDFAITATDRVTQRDSSPLLVTIVRPLPDQTAAPSAAPGATSTPVPALTMTLVGPTEGAISTDGNVLVLGTTTGSRITVESRYLGAPGSDASPSPAASPPASPAQTEVPLSSPTPGPSGTPLPIGPALDITVPSTGSFSEEMQFPLGRWELTITSFGIGVAPITEVRTVSVQPAAASGINLIVTINSRESWLRARADGLRVADLGTLQPGETRTITASTEICIRAGRPGVVAINLNGFDLGILGSGGQAGSWLIVAGGTPTPTEDQCLPTAN